MYDFKLVDGDISIVGDTVSTVSGQELIAQELSLWLQEPRGVKYPYFGSSLSQYIGTPIYNEFIDEIENEVYRVVNEFALYYKRKYERDLFDGIKRYTRGDVIKNINYINVKEDRDAILINISISTFAGDVDVIKVLV